MSILAVIVTYNRLDMLKLCLEKIKSQSFSCDCLIVDNASTDDTNSWCKEFINQESNIKFIYENTGSNIGGAGGFNYGLRRACELGYDYAWIMDDDALCYPDALKKLMDADKKLDGNYGFLGSVVFWTDNTLCVMNAQRKKNGAKMGKNSRVTLEEVHSSTNNELIPIVTSTFVSLLIPTSVIYKVGLPIKEFFIWCDDIEYTRRISTTNNLPCYCVTGSHILHQTKNNVGSDIATDSIERISRYNYAIRNTNYYYRHHLGIKGKFALLYFIFLSNKDILFKAKDNKSIRFKVFWKNMIAGFKFNPPIEFISNE